MKVQLIYFKRSSGKVYSGADIELECENGFEAVAKVHQLWQAKELPGLSKGHDDFIVYMRAETPKYTHVQLIGLPDV